MMRPFVAGEDMSGVSVTKGTLPRVGGMIAKTGDDIWYIPPGFFNAHYEPAGGFMDWLKAFLNG
jgi:hypothetical protein